MRKAASAFMNFRLEIHDLFIKDLWSICDEAGIEEPQFTHLAETTDIDEKDDEDPFAEESNFTENKTAAIFFELRDKGPPHLEAKFKRKLKVYLLIPVINETSRTFRQAFGAGKKMDF